MFKELQLYISILFFSSACSTARTMKSESVSAPQLGAQIEYSSSSASISNDKPRSLDPEAGKNIDFNPSLGLSNVGAGAAVGALLLGGVLVAGQSNNKNATDLNGICLYGDPKIQALVSPCINVTVKLLDENGATVATTSTNPKGKFRFYIPEGEKYDIQVIDRKGRSGSLNQKAGRDDVVSIFLNP